MSVGRSIAKFTESSPNEDSIYFDDKCVAVSDGAGGCGLYADKWSQYLIDKLPKEKPIATFEELDKWVDEIWETFYNEYENEARGGDSMLLNKFYNEGSCATIAAAWREDDKCRWMIYGDSVVFCYNKKSGELQHSFTRLADFSNSPRLVSCKDPLEIEGFKSGIFNLDDNSIVFAASDALSHYILMMYEVSKSEHYSAELQEVEMKATSDSQLLQAARNTKYDFWIDVLMPLIKATKSDEAFTALVKSLHATGLLDIDDYSFVCLGDETANSNINHIE